jgi:tetratricopeptide (TPR) repeat protein
MNRHLLLLHILLAIVLAIVLRAGWTTAADPPAKNARDEFRTRRVWRDFPAEFIDALANKLSSLENAKSFATLCEDTGLLQNNIAKVANEDPAFALGSVATTLTSYANAMGQQRKFAEAKRALEMALLLRPRHLAAWMSLALVSINTNDCKAAVTYADKVLTFKPNPTGNDPWEAGQAEMAADKTAWNEVKAQMNQIKQFCQKKS